MRVGSMLDVIGLIVVGSIITTLVVHPNTATVVNSFGGAVSGALKASQGR